MTIVRVFVVFALLVSFVACTAATGETQTPAELPKATERAAPTDGHATPTAALPDLTACEETFSSVRCANMVDYAAAQLKTSRDEIVTIEVLPPPTPELIDGVSVISLGGATVDTLVRLRDGSVHEVSMGCGGIPPIQCRDDPQLEATSPTLAGYWDVPCSGEPPDGCATPVPSPDPGPLAAAKDLRVPRLDIPIDHDGQYEVSIGEATLPNGILSVAEFEFVSQDWPSDFAIAEGIVRLDIRSLDDPDRLFWNIYDHGRIEGTERVEAFLVFDVLHHDPGAVLSIEDLVVR